VRRTNIQTENRTDKKSDTQINGETDWRKDGRTDRQTNMVDNTLVMKQATTGKGKFQAYAQICSFSVFGQILNDYLREILWCLVKFNIIKTESKVGNRIQQYLIKINQNFHFILVQFVQYHWLNWWTSLIHKFRFSHSSNFHFGRNWKLDWK